MPIPRTLFFVVSALSALALPSLAAEPAFDVRTGHDLAVRWCASCHVVDPDRPGTDAVPTFEAIAAEPDLTPERLKGFLILPHGEMPDFQLSYPYLDAIVDYIESLRP